MGTHAEVTFWNSAKKSRQCNNFGSFLGTRDVPRGSLSSRPSSAQQTPRVPPCVKDAIGSLAARRLRALQPLLQSANTA